MKHLWVILVFFFALNTSLLAQLPVFAWAVQQNASLNEQSNNVISDKLGNTYISGTFASLTITLGDTVFINHAPQSTDVFLAKYNPAGQMLWARQIGGTNDDDAWGITMDPQGNVYFSGSFKAAMTVDGISLSNSGDKDIFVVKYRPNGNIVWAKRFGGGGTDYGKSLAADSCGNVCLAGTFGSYAMSFGSYSLTCHGDSDAFLAKLDSNGTVLWAFGAGGGTFDYGQAVVTDKDCNMYFAGSYSSYIFLYDSLQIPYHGGYDFFIAKHRPDGALLWFKQFGGTGTEILSSIALDTHENLFMTGYFAGPQLNIGTFPLINHSNYAVDFFVAKCDNNGNVLWANSAGGTDDDYAYQVVADRNGNAYVCGAFSSSILNIGTESIYNFSISYYDIFIAKYNPDGELVSAYAARGDKDDYAFGMSLDNLDNMFITGTYSSLNLAFGDCNLAHPGGLNMAGFLTKMENVVGIPEFDNAENGLVYPNPSRGEINILVPQNTTEISIINSVNQVVMKWDTPEKQQISCAGLKPGLYLLVFTSNQRQSTQKFIVY
jgi:hypothetical protein